VVETTRRRLEKEIWCEARCKGSEHDEACEESRAWESRVMLQRWPVAENEVGFLWS
jgi:hypothetical protein